jgi:hypothetical protein
MKYIYLLVTLLLLSSCTNNDQNATSFEAKNKQNEFECKYDLSLSNLNEITTTQDSAMISKLIFSGKNLLYEKFADEVIEESLKGLATNKQAYDIMVNLAISGERKKLEEYISRWGSYFDSEIINYIRNVKLKQKNVIKVSAPLSNIPPDGLILDRLINQVYDSTITCDVHKLNWDIYKRSKNQ